MLLPGYYPGINWWPKGGDDSGWGTPSPGVIYARAFHEQGERSVRVNPDPVPWAVAFLVAAVSSKAAAANMTNKAAAQQFMTAADEAIAGFLDSDDICPRWPYPGPPPWLSIIASELTVLANTLQEGGLQTGLLQVAGQLLDRVALNPQPLPPSPQRAAASR
jgi:hypothetical protein